MLANFEPSPKRCKVHRLWESLDDSDKPIYKAAINDPEKWPALALERELRKRGLTVSNDSILAHRRGMCLCGEDGV